MLNSHQAVPRESQRPAAASDPSSLTLPITEEGDSPSDAPDFQLEATDVGHKASFQPYLESLSKP